MKKAMLLLFAILFAAGTGFALDFTRGPQAVPPGSILASAAMALGNTHVTRSWGSGSATARRGLFGFTFAVDYALPKFGLTVGVESGYLGGSVVFMDLSAIPIMGRLGYHPNLGVENLDVYALFKIGAAIGSLGEDSDTGFGIGAGLGIRYFFEKNLGAFAELGLDHYSLSKKDYEVTVRKMIIIGMTYKR